VLPAVFKTDVTEDLGQAGSIPVRLRQQAYRPQTTLKPPFTHLTTVSGTQPQV
jgi:hypothetical protein